MPTSYPNGLDAFQRPLPTDTMATPGVEGDVVIDNLYDAVEAIEAELGLNPSGVSATVLARLTALTDSLSGVTAATDGHLASPHSAVTTVAGRTGAVTLAAADVAGLPAALVGGLANIGVRRTVGLFSMPFDEPARLLPRLATGAAANAWTMTNGVITPPAAEAADRVALAQGVVLANGIARVVVTNADADLTSGNEYAGIALTRDGGVNRYLAMMIYRKKTADTNRKFAVYAIEGGGYTALVGATYLLDADTNFITGAPTFTLEAERRGKTITFRINGRAVWSSASTAYTYASRVGLIAQTGWLPTLRDFTVTGYLDPPVTPRMTKVLVLGTSITKGIGATGGETGTANWRAQFKARLDAEYAAAPVTVIDGGQSGDTTTGMLARLPALLTANTPDVCVIETSINDAKTTGGVTTETTRANLRAMIAEARAQGATPVLWTATALNPTTVTAVLGGTEYTADSLWKMADNNAVARRVATEEGVTLADVSHSFSYDTTGTLLADGLHPSDAGHDLITDAIFEAVTGSGVR